MKNKDPKCTGLIVRYLLTRFSAVNQTVVSHTYQHMLATSRLHGCKGCGTCNPIMERLQELYEDDYNIDSRKLKNGYLYRVLYNSDIDTFNLQ